MDADDAGTQALIMASVVKELEKIRKRCKCGVNNKFNVVLYNCE